MTTLKNVASVHPIPTREEAKKIWGESTYEDYNRKLGFDKASSNSGDTFELTGKTVKDTDNVKNTNNKHENLFTTFLNNFKKNK